MWATLTKKARAEKQANVSRAWLENSARTRGGVAAAGAAGQNMLLEQQAQIDELNATVSWLRALASERGT